MNRVLLLTAAASVALAQQSFSLQDNRTEDLNCNHIRFCEMRDDKASVNGQFAVDGIHNGSITVRGWSRNEVRVRWRVSIDSATENEARDLFQRVHTRVSGSRASVDGPEPSVTRWVTGPTWDASIEVFAPYKTALRLAAHNGSITVSDIAAQVDARSHNGTVRMERIQGGVGASTHNGTTRLASISGPIEVEAHNGTVNLTNVYGNVRGTSHNGTVTVELAGASSPTRTIDLESHNSPVTLAMPSGFSAQVRADSDNGGVHSDFPTTVRSSGSGMRRIGPGMPENFEIGSGGMSVRLRTHNGGIRIRRL